MSADSGMATFRTDGGWWKIHSLTRKHHMGGQLVRINPEDPDLEGAEGVPIPMKALEACMRLLDCS